jgi:beta-glucanase (GH16 family)
VAAPASAAAPTFSATTTVSVSGTSATATTALTASPATTVDVAGVCARDAAGRNVDFAATNGVRLSTTATTLRATRSLPAGTYSYFTCLRQGSTWTTVGATKTFTVSGSSTTPTPTPTPVTGTTSPSGVAMPTAALTGWRQVFADDFSTPVALGGFPGSSYSSRWDGYAGFTDTSGNGTYTPEKVVSVKNGALDLHLRTEGGKALTAAPVPLVDGAWGGSTYGRYSVRFRADAVAGYKTAWLLWPDSNNWNEGEIDFPEGELNGTINAFVHQPGDPARNALAVGTGVTYTGWHTATVEWLPSGVTFVLDGKQVGRTTVSPSKPMHLVLQTETSGRPSASASGHVQIDWITMHRRA